MNPKHKRIAIGRIDPDRKQPDMFMVQCYEIVKLDLEHTSIRPSLLKGMKKWKYGTRWRKRYKLHKSKLCNEEVFATTIRDMWGYGEFKACFFSRREPNKYNRRDRDGNLRKFTWGFKPRIRIIIKPGYNTETQEDFEYEIKECLMHKLPFWEGKKPRDNNEKSEITGTSYGKLLDNDDIIKL